MIHAHLLSMTHLLASWFDSFLKVYALFQQNLVSARMKIDVVRFLFEFLFFSWFFVKILSNRRLLIETKLHIQSINTLRFIKNNKTFRLVDCQQSEGVKDVKKSTNETNIQPWFLFIDSNGFLSVHKYVMIMHQIPSYLRN